MLCMHLYVKHSDFTAEKVDMVIAEIYKTDEN